MGFRVEDVWDAAVKIVGVCDEDVIFQRITDAVELLANAGDFDPLLGEVDICVSGRCVTLPREVETPIAISIGGRPAIANDQLFAFHINGSQDQCSTSCDWSWADGGLVPTFRDLTEPAKLVAFLTQEEDEDAELWVYGRDENGHKLRTFVNGEWQDGYQVPTVFGAPIPDSEAPLISRVERVRKAVTAGPVRLSTLDNDDTTGVLLGIFEADETDPQYRRIRLNQDADWCRILFRRRVFKIRSQHDWVPLPSMLPLQFCLRALKAYDETELTEGAGFEATARRLLAEAQWAKTPPTQMPIQVSGPTLFDPYDAGID